LTTPDEYDPVPYALTPEGRTILEAAQKLRRRLADYARAESQGVTLLEPENPRIAGMVSTLRESGFDMRYVDDLLNEFQEISDRGCRAFELHFFMGLPPERIAPLMGVPERIASRDVAVAKAWIVNRLKP
jgi:hypothetical protein